MPWVGAAGRDAQAQGVTELDSSEHQALAVSLVRLPADARVHAAFIQGTRRGAGACGGAQRSAGQGLG